MNYIKRLLPGLAIAAALVGVSYIGNLRLEREKENPFLITGMSFANAATIEMTYVLGDFQEYIVEDLDGDSKPERFVLYKNGHAFYKNGRYTGADSIGPLFLTRIYPDAPEAKLLHNLRPDFKLAEPKTPEIPSSKL